MDPASIGQPIHDPGDGFALEANLAIGHEHDLALRIGTKRLYGVADRIRHFGAASCLQITQSTERLSQRAGASFAHGLAETPDLIRKGEHFEAVSRLEAL